MTRTFEKPADRAQFLAPDTLTLLVCGHCGRTDRFVGMTPTPGRHYTLGKRCPGQPTPVKYRKA